MNNDSIVPFLGDRVSFITGLDPLGLQNPSTNIYAQLLPGLNNVTRRIRSYSWYCWLLDEYAKATSSVSPKSQRQFIRRAEYISALLSVLESRQNVSGSDYAKRQREKGNSVYDLKSGTYNKDGTTEGTYWKNPQGVFGQYYLGSLRQIGLIEEPVDISGKFVGVYRRTERSESIEIAGVDLAQAFDKNLTKANKSLFLKCVNEGHISEAQLDQLANDFDLTSVRQNTEESKLLCDLLADIDEPIKRIVKPTRLRRQTIRLILGHLQKRGELDWPYAFTIEVYRGKVVDDECLTGWYFYQLNEYWQFACTAVFNGCLDYLQELRGPGWMAIPDFIAECAANMVKHLKKQGYAITENSKLREFAEVRHESDSKLYDRVVDSQMVERMGFGFQLLVQTFKSNQNRLAVLEEYATLHGVKEDRGFFDFFRLMASRLEQPLGKLIEEFILNWVIGRHQLVAYGKMGLGNQSTHKFIIEENQIRQIGNFEPYFTSPRIGSLMQFLRDLDLVKEGQGITKAGMQFYKSLDENA